MKVTVKKEKNLKEYDFPVMMIHSDDLDRDDPLIVRFSSRDLGVVISYNKEFKDHEELLTDFCWNIDDFIPFHGIITIKT